MSIQEQQFHPQAMEEDKNEKGGAVAFPTVEQTDLGGNAPLQRQ